MKARHASASGCNANPGSTASFRPGRQSGARMGSPRAAEQTFQPAPRAPARRNAHAGGLRSQQLFCLAAGLFGGGRAIRSSAF